MPETLPLLLLAAIFWLFPSAPQFATPPAQNPAQNQNADQNIPVLHVNSHLAVVDIVVHAGREPILGLGRDNFHVTENGVPQTITSIEEHTLQPDAPSGPGLAPVLPPNVYTNFSPVINGGTSIILLDALNTPQKDQMYVRQQMLGFLKDVPKGTTFAVFGLGNQLRLLQPFTNDPAQLLAAIQSSRANPVQSSLLNTDQDDAINAAQVEDAQQATSPGNTPQAPASSQPGEASDLVSNIQQFQAEEATFQYELRVRITMEALTQIAGYVATQPGRKNLIWVSGSFPATILPNAALGTGGFDSTSNLSPLIRATTDLLTQARISVYPIDARGLMTSPTFDASTSPQGKYAPRGLPTISTSESRFLANLDAEHSAMNAVAEQTGGRAFYNTNGIKEAMQASAVESSHYYTLSYVPTNKNFDGKVRRVSVKVTPGNYELNYRKTYIADDPNAPRYAVINLGKQDLAALDPVHAAFEAGAPNAKDILFDAVIRPVAATPEQLARPAGTISQPWKGAVVRYSIDYAVKGGDLRPQPADGGRQMLKLEFAAIAYDELGRAVNSVSQHVDATLTETQAVALRKGGLPFHQEIDLPAVKLLFLRVGVGEEASGRAGTLEVNVTPKASKPVH